MGHIELKKVQKDFGRLTVIPPLDLEIGEENTMTVRAPGKLSLNRGDKVYITPQENMLHRFNQAGLRIN